MPILLRLGYSLGVVITIPFVTLYSAATGFLGALEGACQLIWDAWR